MKREKAGILAEYLRTIRPEWDLLATLNAIAALNAADENIEWHCLSVAKDQKYRTPAAIEFTFSDQAAHSDSIRPGDKRSCRTCGRTEWACRKAQDNSRRIMEKVARAHGHKLTAHPSDLDIHQYQSAGE